MVVLPALAALAAAEETTTEEEVEDIVDDGGVDVMVKTDVVVLKTVDEEDELLLEEVIWDQKCAFNIALLTLLVELGDMVVDELDIGKMLVVLGAVVSTEKLDRRAGLRLVAIVAG